MSMCYKCIVVLFVAAVLSLGLGMSTQCAPAISGLSAPATASLHGKLEISFSVATVATNLYWPYDPAPAANVDPHKNAVPTGVGVTVDGLFLPPGEGDWSKAVVQPAFYCQDYERESYLGSGRDWLYPNGDPCWRIRFSPTLIGQWHYRIKVTDSSGTTTYDPPTNTFQCGQSALKGFVRVSTTDPRYFETSDGRSLSLIGLSGISGPTQSMDADYAKLGSNGINLIRPWWQGSWGPVLFGIGGQGGVLTWRYVAVSSSQVRPNQLFSYKINSSDNTCYTSVCIKPNKQYRFSAWAKPVGLVGTSPDTGIFLAAFRCLSCTMDTPRPKGDDDWTQISATIQTDDSDYEIGWLKIGYVGTGSAYFNNASLREILGPGSYGPELISRPDANAYTYIAQDQAWMADYETECAARNGVYLKVCLQEKADPVFSAIGADGRAAMPDDNNVYASPSHAGRVYQTYFWRYMIARYGYAASIHSFEFCNEGDPFNGNHYDGTQAMAKYFKVNDPNHHMVTASFWHSFPTGEFWANSSYPDPGYADWHSYHDSNEIWGWGTASLDTDHFYTGKSSGYRVGNGDDGGLDMSSVVIPVAGGHSYTVNAHIKGEGLTASGTQGDISWVFPTIAVIFQAGYSSGPIVNIGPGRSGDNLGTYDWKSWSGTVTAPANATYMRISPTTHWAVGKWWVDDIAVYDNTSGKSYNDLPNGGYERTHIACDSALLSYSGAAVHVGCGEYRSVLKPTIHGEVGITGLNIYGDPYKGVGYGGENQQLVDDHEGIWFRKFVWAQIAPFGVTEMYWWKGNIVTYNLYIFAKAYQAFMSGIELNNGHYQDARATTSTTALRAWGQKDLTDNKAHLWIDNAPYTWKAVVDHNYSPEPWNGSATYIKDSTCGFGSPVHVFKSLQDGNTNHPTSDTAWWQDTGAFDAANNPPLPSSVSGTVTISGFKDGPYRVEWWDTSTGTITRTEDATGTSGQIQLSVQSLQSDIACKVYPRPAKVDLRVIVPSDQVIPGETVSVSVQYTNSGSSDAQNVIVSARVPAQMDYVSGSAEETGGSYDSITQTVMWNVSLVAAGETGTKIFKARVR